MIIFQYFKWDKCVTSLNTRACLKVHIPRNHHKPWYFLVYTNICLWILWFDNISKGIVKLRIFNKHWNWLKVRIKAWRKICKMCIKQTFNSGITVRHYHIIGFSDPPPPLPPFPFPLSGLGLTASVLKKFKYIQFLHKKG